MIGKKNILILCLISVFLLMIATVGLGVVGVLETTEQGDIEYISTEQFSDRPSVTVSSNKPQFAIESPTDANAFYNAVIRANNGGPLINRGISKTEGTMAFHYHPITYYFYATLSIFGYVKFKFLLLIASALAVMTGTALLILAEREYVDIHISKYDIILLAVASAGVGPVLSNLKTGQTTPFLYFCLGLFWWGYRHRRLRISGVMVAVATFFKPYAIAPIALGFNQENIHIPIWTFLTYVVGTLFAVAVFGTSEIIRYFNIIKIELFEESAQNASQITSASNLELLNWTGDFSVYLSIMLFIPLFYIGVKYLIDESSSYSISLFSATLMSIFILLSDTSAIDMPLLLPVIILIGLHTYSDSEKFWMLALIFVLFHIHPPILEVLVGNGSKYIPLLSSNQHILQAFIPILQPGIYSVFGLYYLTFVSTTVSSTVDS